MTTTKPPVDDQGREFDVFDPRCPSRTALHDVTNKWAPLILITLDDGAGRFGEIHRAIGGSSERMISQTLSVLADGGMVLRELDEGGRPLYHLTPGGKRITGCLRELRDAVYAHLASSSDR